LNTYEKYLGKFWYILLRGLYPPFGENYDAHWNYLSFKGKVILDFGADYGSSAYYFWKKGATKVVAVEGNHENAEKLKKNASKYRFIVPVEKYVDSSDDFALLINHYHPDLTKVDVEGSEIHLLTCKDETLVKVPEWLVECHSFEAYKQLKRKFSSLSFRVSSSHVNSRHGPPVIVLIVVSKN
jgi:precorrin-6B methylase 2